MIRNIVFDIGRVLVGFEWMDYARGMFDEERVQRVTDAMWRTGHWWELDRGTAPEEVLELFFRADPGVRDEIQEAFDRVGECVRRLDYAIPWIESLKERGYRVYFLSNYSEYLMGTNPGALDFVPHMDGGVFSCYAKAIKPEPAIYQALFDQYDLDPRECIFIDDMEANVRTAKDLGMTVIRFENREQAAADLERWLAYDRLGIGQMRRGYTHIYTGGGKGKTTAALGLAMRAAGAGLRVYLGEFIKEMEYGEIGILRERFPEVKVELFGTSAGCLIDRQPTEEDLRGAAEGLDRAEEAMKSGDYDLVILDEVTVAVELQLLPEERVLQLMDEKPDSVELVLTGRGATEAMRERADLVTEMEEVKHYYRQGVCSRKGIEC